MLRVISELGYRPKIVSSVRRQSRKSGYGKDDWTMPAPLIAALLEADQAHKLVFVDFYAKWCGACKTLEETTLANPKFKQTMQRFVFTKIDTDEYPETARHFKIVGMPTLLVLDISGRELYRHIGPIGVNALVAALPSQ